MRAEGGGIRHRFSPIALVVCAFVVASGTAALAYGATQVSGTGRAQAVSLGPPSAPSVSSPTTTSLSLHWAASSDLPTGGGYLVLRSTSPDGPYAKVSSGTCAQSITLVSPATSCTDTGLTPGTTYSYEVEAAFYDISTLWVSTPTPSFSATTTRAPSITSSDSATFTVGNEGTFTVTTTGLSAPVLSDAGFTGCTPSALPATVTLADHHDGTAALTGTPPASSAGTYVVCITATDGTSTATQKLVLTVVSAPPAGTVPNAAAITSASSAEFPVGVADAFQVTASGSPAPAFSDAAFSGCTPSVLPSGITLAGNGLFSGTPGPFAVGTYTVCVVATGGTGANGTQKFSLTIDTEKLVISSAAVAGATSSTPNLGPITVQRQTGSGAPITTGGDLKVDLASSISAGATFGQNQFSASPVTVVTIPNGQSSTTFWYGSTTTGTPTLTASATNFVAATQMESITTAPTGLGVVLAAGSTGSPVLSCGSPGPDATCTITGIGSSGGAVVSVAFWGAGHVPVVYSATQSSTISESGQSTGSIAIDAGASGSGAKTLTLPAGTSTLTFGPYRLDIDVS